MIYFVDHGLITHFQDQDTGLCWQTFEPQTDTAVAATGTSGRCETKCYVKAYKYKETTGSVAAPVTTFHWFLERGCAQKDEDIETGSSPSSKLEYILERNLEKINHFGQIPVE